MKSIPKIMALYMLALAAVSCAATPVRTPQQKDVVLLNADRPEIREAIRVFVRKDAGRFVIADPDTLAQTPNLVVRRRAQDYESQIRKLPTANLNYHLVSRGKDCWLIRHETGLDSPIAAELLLPNIARCAVYTEK